MNSKIWLSPPHMSGEEQKFIKEAFSTNWIAPAGSCIDEFETDIQQFISNSASEKKEVLALNSGTSAIHLGLILLGVSKGDEVICQSFTFVASANPIKYLGAEPIFVDSEMETWNLCPLQLKIAIEDCLQKGKKPKAIIAVHSYGMPYNIEKIHAVAQLYDIPVLEDSAEALGSQFKNNYCGSFGKFALFSFNGNKIITTSGGGALICNNKKTKNEALYLATQAQKPNINYEHSDIGYNYRLSNISAAIGRGQFKVLQERIQSRRDNFTFYYNALKDCDEISFLVEPKDYFSNRWLTCILTTSYKMREAIKLALDLANIESRTLWKPLHLQPVFKHNYSYTNGVSEDLYQRGLCLPSGSNLSEKDLKRIVAVIKKQI